MIIIFTKHECQLTWGEGCQLTQEERWGGVSGVKKDWYTAGECVCLVCIYRCVCVVAVCLCMSTHINYYY